MKAVADVIVRKRKLVITLMLLLTAVCVYCMTKVEVVTDMTRYLPEKSAMKQGMDVMGEAFPTVETENTIRVLFHDLSEEEKTTIAEKLSTLTYASGVDYVPQSEAYNKDQYTLFVVRTVYGYGSKEEKQLERMIRKEFQDHAPEVMNDSPMVSELQFSAIAIALAILFLILFVMSGSWFETILFLITIGIAVGINLGTNLFQGSVSNITHMIAAILQLVLSMDYSIIMMDRYRQLKDQYPNKEETMKAAIVDAFSSITGSSVTTFVGLLALVFMSFKIGKDLGVVLAKGVLISMFCVFTVLPGLILIFDRLIEKTEKNTPHFHMDFAGRFEFKFRYAIVAAFFLIFAGSIYLKGGTEISFTMPMNDSIAEVFPKTNPIVLIYPNEEDERITAAAEKLLADDDKVLSATSYSLFLAKQLKAEELVDMISQMGAEFPFDISVIKMIYYDYYNHDNLPKVSKAKLMAYALKNRDSLQTLMESSKELLGEEKEQGGFSLDDTTMDLFALYYLAQTEYDESWTLSILDLFDHVADTMVNDERFSMMIDDSMREEFSSYRSMMQEGAAQLKGEKVSRLILETIYQDEDMETYDFVEELKALFVDGHEENCYLIGSPVMNSEMKATFDVEMRNITWITVIAIFLVVAVTFRSVLIPLILVLIVQCGVYCTITIIGFQGYSIFYLALLMVQCILMGATIDYGILFTNYYCSRRQTMGIEEALTESYNGSLHTVLTSGLILVLVTAIISGFFDNPAIGQICSTISKGALSAIILILIFLPGLLAAADRFIVKKK